MNGLQLWHIGLDASPIILALMILRSAIKLVRYAHVYRHQLKTQNEHLHNNQHIAIGMLAIAASIPFVLFQILNIVAEGQNTPSHPYHLLFESLSIFSLDLMLLCAYWFFEHMKDEEGGWFGYAHAHRHAPGFKPEHKPLHRGWRLLPDPLLSYLRMFL